jgi:hypothetical protein
MGHHSLNTQLERPHRGRHVGRLIIPRITPEHHRRRIPSINTNRINSVPEPTNSIEEIVPIGIIHVTADAVVQVEKAV